MYEKDVIVCYILYYRYLHMYYEKWNGKAALSAYVTTPPMLPLPPLFLVALPAPTSSAAVATSTAAVATSIAAVATVE